MSFSISGSGKTKSEARKMLSDSFEGSQPYAPLGALHAAHDALEKQGEPPEGKLAYVSISGHSSVGGNDQTNYSLSCCFQDAPNVEAPAPAADTKPIAE